MYKLLLLCLLPMALGHFHKLDQEHHFGHHHHHGHQNHGQDEKIGQSARVERNVEQTSPKLKILKDREDQTCKCVPYYGCNMDLIAVNVQNASVTGYGRLDLRRNTFTGRNGVVSPCPGRDVCCEPADVIEPPTTAAPDITPSNPSRTNPSTPTNPSRPNPPTPKPATLKSCGIRNSKGLDFDVVKLTGKEALYGEFPWVVAILDSSKYYGGGSLIHPQVVVTAAHVVRGRSLTTLRVRAGVWDTKNNNRLGPQERRVKEIYLHEGLLDSVFGNNIALLLLEQPVQLDEHINVVCLPDKDEDFTGFKECVANGWGMDAFFGVNFLYAEVMKRVELDIVEGLHCQSLLRRKLGGRFSLHSSMVCAGGEKGKDTCYGDGGGPLACPVGDDRYKLTGVIVGGVSCGLEDVPALYTNVSQFRQWVDDKMVAWGFDNTTYTAPSTELILRPRRIGGV